MRTIRAQQGQNIFDVAIIALGSAMGAILIAEENDLSITATLTAGQELRIPEQLISKTTIKDLAKNGIKPATGVSGMSTDAMVHYAVASYVVPNYWI